MTGRNAFHSSWYSRPSDHDDHAKTSFVIRFAQAYVVQQMSDDDRYFPISLQWTGRKTGLLSVEGKDVIRTGVPLDDQDEASGYTPEDLFVASAAICYMNGFIEFTRKMHIEFKSFDCDAVGNLERVGRSFEITQIEMTARVTIESDEVRGKIERALELAAKYCFVGNSMKCPITHRVEISVT